VENIDRMIVGVKLECLIAIVMANWQITIHFLWFLCHSSEIMI